MSTRIIQITNGRILTPGGWVKGGSVIVEDNRISKVSSSESHVEGATVVDVGGGNIVRAAVEDELLGAGDSVGAFGCDRECSRTLLAATERQITLAVNGCGIRIVFAVGDGV